MVVGVAHDVQCTQCRYFKMVSDSPILCVFTTILKEKHIFLNLMLGKRDFFR